MVITLFLILVPSLVCNRKLLIDKKRGSEGDYSSICYTEPDLAKIESIAHI